MHRVHITLSNVNKIFIISQVYLLKNNSKSLNHYWIIPVKQEQLMVCLHFLVQLNSDLLYVNQLPVCTAGTANRLIQCSLSRLLYIDD